MPLSIGSGSAWKNLVSGAVGVSGAWKSLLGIWVGVGGVWKFVWAAINAQAVSADDSVIAPTAASAFIEFRNTGAVDTNEASSLFQWTQGGVASDYDIYLSGTGNTPGGSVLNTWLNLGTNRSWTLSQSGQGVKSFTGTYQIRHSASGTVLGSNSFSLSVSVEI